MKLTFNPDGSYSMDVASVEEAAALVRKVNQDNSNDSNDGPCNINSLNAKEMKTYEFLVENDCEEGVHFRAFARWAGITDKAANQRFYNLKVRGFAVTGLRRGHYRAKD